LTISVMTGSSVGWGGDPRGRRRAIWAHGGSPVNTSLGAGRGLAARAMKLQGHGGRIVNTTSLSGLLGNFGQANYGAAKAGIYGLTRVAAMELERHGIAVNAIAPVALTRMTSDLKAFQGASERDLGPRFVAPAVVFLASPLAEGIAGQVLGVQGGKIFLYRMETTSGADKDPALGPWSAEEIRAAWDRIAA
jgi:hypothetical protein